MKTATVKTPKTVTVLNVYKFKSPLNRICFETLSSDEQTRYHTCFSNDAEHGSCTCPGGESIRHKCYHMDGLRARAAEYFDSRQPESDETPGLDAAEAYLASLREQEAEDKEWEEAKRIATAWQDEQDTTLHSETYLERLHRYEREREERKRDAWKETAQFTPSHTFERAPSGKLVPMR